MTLMLQDPVPQGQPVGRQSCPTLGMVQVPPWGGWLRQDSAARGAASP